MLVFKQLFTFFKACCSIESFKLKIVQAVLVDGYGANGIYIECYVHAWVFLYC